MYVGYDVELQVSQGSVRPDVETRILRVAGQVHDSVFPSHIKFISFPNPFLVNCSYLHRKIRNES